MISKIVSTFSYGNGTGDDDATAVPDGSPNDGDADTAAVPDGNPNDGDADTTPDGKDDGTAPDPKLEEATGSAAGPDTKTMLDEAIASATNTSNTSSPAVGAEEGNAGDGATVGAGIKVDSAALGIPGGMVTRCVSMGAPAVVQTPVGKIVKTVVVCPGPDVALLMGTMVNDEATAPKLLEATGAKLLEATCPKLLEATGAKLLEATPGTVVGLNRNEHGSKHLLRNSNSPYARKGGRDGSPENDGSGGERREQSHCELHDEELGRVVFAFYSCRNFF